MPRRLLRALLALALISTAALTASPPAQATSGYGSPSWLPFRGTIQIGCARNNGCGPNAHGYWAIDFPLERNQPVYATGKGQVVIVQSGQGGNCDPDQFPNINDCPNGKKGNAVLIDHGPYGYTLYGHFTSISVTQGQWVTEGTVLGGAGDSGWAPPGFVHVHYEQWAVGDGNLVDVVANPQKVEPNDLSGCIGATKVTYPGHDGGASWDDLVAFESVLENDGGCNPNESSCVSGFVDVPSTQTFCPDIKWMVGSGITSGYADGLFHPGRTTNRQEAVMWLYRQAGSPAGPFPDPGLSDVSSSSIFYKAISWGVANGVVTGYSDNTFKPTRDVNRAEFVTFLYRDSGSPGAGPNPGFSDVPTSNIFYAPISWGAAHAIVTGYSDHTFRPGDNILRDAGSAFTHRFDSL